VAMDANVRSLSVVSDVPVSNLPADHESISSKKLLKSSFEKFESRRGILTRKHAKDIGLGSVCDVEMASSFRMLFC
jgi:hypothetical protein